MEDFSHVDDDFLLNHLRVEIEEKLRIILPDIDIEGYDNSLSAKLNILREENKLTRYETNIGYKFRKTVNAGSHRRISFERDEVVDQYNILSSAMDRIISEDGYTASEASNPVYNTFHVSNYENINPDDDSSFLSGFITTIGLLIMIVIHRPLQTFFVGMLIWIAIEAYVIHPNGKGYNSGTSQIATNNDSSQVRTINRNESLKDITIQDPDTNRIIQDISKIRTIFIDFSQPNFTISDTIHNGDEVLYQVTQFINSHGYSFEKLFVMRYTKNDNEWKNIDIQPLASPIRVKENIVQGNFDSASGDAIVKDIDGNIYETIHIGTQIWMKENLRVTHFRDGTAIMGNENALDWSSYSPEWCYCNGKSTNDQVCGKLYNWHAVKSPHLLSPVGWHIPSDLEWTNLLNYLGGDAVAGGHMKATTQWQSPNTGGDNSSDLTTYPTGYRHNGGSFDRFGYESYFWSSTEYDIDAVWVRVLFYDNSQCTQIGSNEENGYSVRCVKD